VMDRDGTSPCLVRGAQPIMTDYPKESFKERGRVPSSNRLFAG
jgi:hypothetical protein